MPIVETIDTILQLIHEGSSDYTEDMNAFACTLETLRQSVKNLDEKNLTANLFEKIFSDLIESRDTIKRLFHNKSWFRNITNFLPGSDIQKLRKKNEHLMQSLNLITVLYSTKANKTTKIVNEDSKMDSSSTDLDDDSFRSESQIDSARKRIKKETKSYPQTGKSDFLKPYDQSNHMSQSVIPMSMLPMKTQPSQPLFNKKSPMFIEETAYSDYQGSNVAFKLNFIYHPEYFANISSEERLLSKNVNWERDFVEYKIERMSFDFLPEALLGRISREHAAIFGYRQAIFSQKNDAIIAESDSFPSHSNISESGTILLDSPDNSIEKQPEKKKFTTHFTLQDESPNKSYVLKNHSYGNIFNYGGKVKGKFKALSAGEKTELQHLDIVGIRINLSTKEILFGFQFLCENL